MDHKIEVDMFIDFLISNEIYEEYNNLLLKIKSTTIMEYVKNLTSLYGVIDHSLSLHSTKGGSPYWHYYANKWNIIITNNKPLIKENHCKSIW